MSFIYNLTDTWNNGATAFTAVKMNVTDTASAAGSLLMDLQVGGASKFQVSKADTYLYNSYTDASNYERGIFSWTAAAGGLTIGTTAAGTGARRDIYLVAGTEAGGGGQVTLSAAGDIIFARYGTGARWTVVGNTGHFIAATDNTFDIGIAGNAARYIRASSAIQTKALTVATLPAAATALAGARSFVTDSSVAASTNFGAIVAGAGANSVPVYSDGTNWRIG